MGRGFPWIPATQNAGNGTVFMLVRIRGHSPLVAATPHTTISPDGSVRLVIITDVRKLVSVSTVKQHSFLGERFVLGVDRDLNPVVNLGGRYER